MTKYKLWIMKVALWVGVYDNEDIGYDDGDDDHDDDIDDDAEYDNLGGLVAWALLRGEYDAARGPSHPDPRPTLQVPNHHHHHHYRHHNHHHLISQEREQCSTHHPLSIDA